MSRPASFAIVALAYTLAVAAAVAVGAWLWPEHPLWIGLAADLTATAVLFAASVAVNNSSMYDTWWSVAPLGFAAFWLVVAPGDAPLIRQIAVTALVVLWGVRLTWNWARGWRGLDHEDWRYVNIRNWSGRAYWLMSFVGIQLMPTLVVFGGCLGLWVALSGTRPVGWLDAVALVTMATAIAVEALADRQLRSFRLADPPTGAICRTGLWAWCRHPNYFGEILFWWGLALFGLAADPSRWWVLAGPLAISVLFAVVSLPLIERRMAARRESWAEHARRTSLLVPWPPQR